ncbi:MAG: NAD-dependent protein deacylase [Gammaproteobacteria bacterium]|nr:MAG: NAD-dependent protein deacylase [Gammaproteobacteria bacterium]
MAGGPIVILTGAGISRESGLETFRDKDGLWSRVSIDEVATPEAFARDSERVHAFYNARRRQLLNPEVQPNAAHRALAELERGYPGDVLLVTQNIDDLHERGGSVAPQHMHGELLKARCTCCGRTTPWRDDLATTTRCPACDHSGGMRPHVVWFGEIPLSMERIQQALICCELFISIGTSGQVYPAAGFVAEARAAGARTVELNLERSVGPGLFDQQVEGSASEIVPAFVASLLTVTNTQ